ncbi:16S rRNA (cytosine(967)-C(5))-methyltransferase RsmB [Fusobacterium russii]|uniref:16S rRNA (cytosine(967)-C(5))-methyltransferase RsmB n=1 Tax=Fusobacterium russii TaxID=854 RepID=UPI0003A70B94|nr:16S rRNA (cytosine(967)-C(5))-methyltransferase RsmB [Fusobacterium russii]
MNVKQIAINLISKVDRGGYSNIILNDTLREFQLSLKEKAFLTEIFYGVLRNKKFLDYMIEKNTKEIKKEWIRNLLRISIYQISFMTSDNKGVVWEATELAKKKYGLALSKFINATLRNYLRNKEETIDGLKIEKNFEVLYSSPKWFCELLEKQYGVNFEEAIKSYKKIPYLSVRVNKLKYSEVEFEEYLKRNSIAIIKKVGTVYYIDSGIIINSEEFKTGKIIAQDASSYMAAINLNSQAGDLILDICAAPGGKTAIIAEEMTNEGEIIALDIHQHKIKLIESNMEKLGVKIVKPIVMDARNVNKQGRKFDRILADVPCSGYGVIRKKPEILYNKVRENIEELSKLQLEILNAAADILKDGGTIIYSTCTITNEENTENIRKFLSNRKEFKVGKLYIPKNVAGEYDEFGGFCINYKEEIMDGFYMIKLIKENTEG